MTKKVCEKEIALVLCGEAGQGIQTIEQALTHILRDDGYYTFSTSEFMSRIRGGVNSTSIRVASAPVHCYSEQVDVVVALTPDALTHLGARITDDTCVIGNKECTGTHPSSIDVDFTALAKEAGSKQYANTVALGFLCALFGTPQSAVDTYITTRFAEKSEEVQEENCAAARAGAKAAKDAEGLPEIRITRAEDEARACTIIDGATSVVYGAITGGCDCVSSYPMSPSTSVLVGMARHAHTAGIIVEQAEDEIAAINMALGAWYAGARALVTTSGGGFALMCEGISLAGMIETPVVIHLAQRPGPATGLPTRTEQGDLDLALYAGHGEFPRVIYAPGTPEEAFQLTCKAFNIADKYQITVIILTDQYLLDSRFHCQPLSPEGLTCERYIVRTEESYKRYALTDDGISPRGIPGHGEGIVAVDSDEHTEEGYITESMHVRTEMVDKRMRKLPALREESVAPTRYGRAGAPVCVICWGSTYYTVKEACERIGRDDVTVLHFSQVYPVPENMEEIWQHAKKLISVENNVTGQFARVLHRETGRKCDAQILSYDGMPFAVEDVTTRLADALDA